MGKNSLFIRRFKIFPVLENKEGKIPVIFPFSWFVGSKGNFDISPAAGTIRNKKLAKTPEQRAEYRPAGLIVMQGTAGRNALFICIFSERGKVALSAGRKHRFNSNFSGKEKQQHTAATPPPQPDISRRYQRFPPPRRGYVPDKGKSAAYLEQVSTTVPKFAYPLILPLRETCWGVPSPNPAMAACAAKIFLSGRRELPRKYLTTPSIFCDK